MYLEIDHKNSPTWDPAFLLNIEDSAHQHAIVMKVSEQDAGYVVDVMEKETGRVVNTMAIWYDDIEIVKEKGNIEKGN